MIDPRFYQLVKHLWRGGSWAYYWTPDTDQGKLSEWFPVSEVAQVPFTWERINSYFSVHPVKINKGKHYRGSITDIEAVNCLYAEFDIEDPKQRDFTLQSIQTMDSPPSVVVFSGGGYHAYWLLDETFAITGDASRARIQNIQYAWIDFVSSSDDAVKDLARVLRIPGSHNRKPKYAPNYPQVEIVVFDIEKTYTLDDLEKQVWHIITEAAAVNAARNSSNATITPVSVDDHELIDRMRATNDSADALWRGDMSAHGDDHSKSDLALCTTLAFWFGRDTFRMDAAFRQSGLMRDKWLRDDYREKTLQKAVDGCPNTYTPPAPRGDTGDVASLVGAPSAVNFSVNGNHKTLSATAPVTITPAQSSHSQNQPFNNQPNFSAATNLFWGFANEEDALLNLAPTDWGHAQCLFMLYGYRFLYCAAYDYMFYDGKCWRADLAEEKLKQAVIDTLRARRIEAAKANSDVLIKACKDDAYRVKAVIYLVRLLLGTGVESFDADPDSLNCNNGVVDLRTGMITPHDSKQRFTYCVPVDYNQKADYVDWLTFLSSVVVHVDLVEYMQQCVGYSLTGHTREECMFYIHGPTRSGKGTFAETILKLLGKPLAVQADFKTFTADRVGDTQNFDLAPLKPARFVVASESDRYEKLNEAKIKTVTGGDDIRCAFKHRDHFEYRPQFKIWLLSNHPIKGDVDDDAFWGRVRIVEFPNSRLGTEDKTLKERLKSDASLSGVLRWAVEGAMKWYAAQAGLKTPDVVNENSKKRRLELDHVQQWIDACCKANPLAWTKNEALYYSYTEWCKGNGITPKGSESLGQAVGKKGFKTGVQRRVASGARSRGVEGIEVL